ncbi:MAG: hypothetical protein Q8L87_20900 [Anaerolineales bacterium]|nr:hypothetical protein [Anaerolineales bacterium]
MKKQGIVLVVLLFASLACGVSSPAAPETSDVESAVAATLTALSPLSQETEATPTQAGGVAVSFSGAGFTIPQGLATGATPAVIPASLDPQAPTWDIHPSFAEFALDGYILHGKFHEPVIRIYPVTEFESVNEGAAGIINEMRDLLTSQGSPLPFNLPFLPLFNAGQMFHSNEQFIAFQNGTGLRYLTQYGQDISPVNNHALFYTFQGITNDGKYYVSAILPVNAPFLVEFPSPEYPTPPNGIPFDWENWENAQAYMDAVTQQLNSTDPTAFTPPLTTLDTFIASILVTGTP